MYLKNILFSFKTTIVLLSILAIAAGVATFIENDFGTSSALFLVYNSVWYETILVLTTINLVAIIYKTKMWNKMPRFLFHFSFVVILNSFIKRLSLVSSKYSPDIGSIIPFTILYVFSSS